MCQEYPIVRFREFKISSIFSDYRCCCGQERRSLPLKTQWAIVGIIILEMLMAAVPNALLIGIISRIWIIIVDLLWISFECIAIKIIAYRCYFNFMEHKHLSTVGILRILSRQLNKKD